MPFTRFRCFFRLFYPIDKDLLDGDQSKRALWLPGSEYAKGYASVVNIPGFSLCAKIIAGSRRIPAVWNAPLASSESPFPVIVFSHGLSSCRTTYCCICIDLASHGFIVAAAEHRDESACISYYIKNNNSDGKFVKELVKHKKAPHDDFELRNYQVKQRAEECIATLDTLTDMHDGKEVENIMPDKFDFTQLQGKLDLDRVAICGHSFGGGTSIVAMSKDSRFKCSVPLDAWLFPLSGDVYEKVQQPILFINTYYFQWKDNISKMNKLMPSEYNDARRLLTIRETVHFSQSDIPLLLPLAVSKKIKYTGSLRPDIALEINNRAMLAFLWQHLSEK
ncbi:putative platelet-activating factor acetylhydrolase-like [Apostichopus japonicus]|uniref:1-alkyl-2-acetylglycerophosphocholine esterase n=1 Tax=Stichopus japonicus TaxID=307972 RepID=A0A2G8K2B8_STIJA|nr:putative platelet-activating factor acetylhydrolase-like [Apostichopus japonicus]